MEGPAAMASGYGILAGVKHHRRLVIPVLILIPTLACSAATRLLTGSDPIPVAHTTGTPSPAALAPLPAEQASCPAEARAVVMAANKENLPPGQFPRVDTSASLDVPLVTYGVSGDELSTPILAKVPDNLIEYQRDFASQRAAWQLFTELIPADSRGMLAQFQIMTDGPGAVLSAVEQTRNDPRRWILETDIADAADTRNLAFTLLHEYGHLLTLGPNQVPPDLEVFNNPDSQRTRNRAEAACQFYFPGEGCSLSTSYMNSFFDLFWKGIYDEWSAIDQIRDGDRRDIELNAFYREYRDRFVDSYAVTSPVEDIAESWAFYVLSPRPANTKIVDQKLEFFDAYPELAALRGHILSGLCAANP
jgi:hypothetical protein